jgi:hypothetical protein
VEGRNRFLGCNEAGIEHIFQTLPAGTTEEQIVAIIVSGDLHRLHLNTGQRALIAAQIESKYVVEAKERQRRTLRRGTTPGPRCPLRSVYRNGRLLKRPRS